MIHGRSTWDDPQVIWTLESTDPETGYKIIKYKDGVANETLYPDKAAAEAAWETLNEEMIQPEFTP